MKSPMQELLYQLRKERTDSKAPLFGEQYYNEKYGIK